MLLSISKSSIFLSYKNISSSLLELSSKLTLITLSSKPNIVLYKSSSNEEITPSFWIFKSLLLIL